MDKELIALLGGVMDKVPCGWHEWEERPEYSTPFTHVHQCTRCHLFREILVWEVGGYPVNIKTNYIHPEIFLAKRDE